MCPAVISFMRKYKENRIYQDRGTLILISRKLCRRRMDMIGGQNRHVKL